MANNKMENNRMKAVVYTRYGGPEVLSVEEKAVPIPNDDQMLIRVYASTISSADASMRRAEPFITRLFNGLTKPKITTPGDVVCGEVVSVGGEVKKFKVGDKIYGASDLDQGAHAQYKVMKEDAAITIMPSNKTYIEAAAIVDGSLTALPFLRDSGMIKKGDKVLINGASGSVGVMGIQFAKYYGATVTAVCSESNFELVKSLGADDVIDYTIEDFAKGDERYDIIFDAVGKRTYKNSKPALKETGVYMTTVPGLGVMIGMLLTSKSKGKKARFLAAGIRKAEERIKDFDFIRGLMEKDVLDSVIGKVYPMEDVVEANIYVETGHKKGNVVINLE